MMVGLAGFRSGVHNHFGCCFFLLFLFRLKEYCIVARRLDDYGSRTNDVIKFSSTFFFLVETPQRDNAINECLALSLAHRRN